MLGKSNRFKVYIETNFAAIQFYSAQLNFCDMQSTHAKHIAFNISGLCHFRTICDTNDRVIVYTPYTANTEHVRGISISVRISSRKFKNGKIFKIHRVNAVWPVAS